MWALWSGLALWRVLCRLGVSDARLKWPNDVWIGARKVAGILVESGPWRVADLQSLIIGIGVNIHGSPHDFPPDLEHKVTTLARELQQAPSVALVLQSWLDELQAISQELKRHGPAILLQEWEQGAQLQGQAVHLETVQGTLQGIVEGLHEHGFLRVRLADGRQHLHTSGDVWWSEHKV
jgi:BirA family biotin operon repressor/biotin-[acetyl-CoA-carboxylase] ligase